MTRRAAGPLLKCFPPLADSRSKVLILGSMPGPMALRKREYYGFPGNHFWPIMAALFRRPPFASYAEKKRVLKEKGVALWDVIASCRRKGALDSRIADAAPNDVAGLLRRRRNIRAVFLNGRLSEKLFHANAGDRLDRPVFYLPSTSPAHAALPFARKLARWKPVLDYL